MCRRRLKASAERLAGHPEHASLMLGTIVQDSPHFVEWDCIIPTYNIAMLIAFVDSTGQVWDHQWCRRVCVCAWGGGGATFLITIEESGGMPPPPQKLFWYFHALRQLLVQSEANFLIEQLNFVDHTDLVLWLTYCMKKKKSSLHFRVQTCPKIGVPPPYTQ